MPTTTAPKFSFKRTILDFLSKVLPDHSKRQILFASLAAYKSVADKTRFNKATISKLNQVMALSEHDSALELPVKLSRVIWSGSKGDTILFSLSDNSIPPEKSADQLISLIPDWLRYSNTKGMREDVIKLITEQRRLFSQAA